MRNQVRFKAMIVWIVFFLMSITLANDSPKYIVVKFKPNTIHIPAGQKVAKLKDMNKNRSQIKKYFIKLSHLELEFTY